MPRCIFHLDLDVFFVAVERVLDPSLVGKPVIVSPGTGRSVVAAASYEARRFGVRSAMPFAQAQRLCPQALVCPGNFSAYQKYSRDFFKILEHYSPDLEPVSLDEGYLDFTQCAALFGPPLSAAAVIQQRVKDELGLDVSIGIAANKLVAKIASDMSKPAGILRILPGRDAAFMAPMPIGRLLGVGPKTETDMKQLGIKTIGTLARLSRADMESVFGSQGASWQNWARGIDPSPVLPRERAKSIGREETFLIDRIDRKELRGVLQELASDVAYRLRGQGFKTRTVCLKVRYADFSLHTHSRTLAEPTHWDRDIFTASQELLEKALERRLSIRLLGISAHNLADERVQLDLLDSGQHERLDRLHTAADRLRKRYGYESVAWAGLIRKK
jgi:DNA polymerase-4